MRIAKGDIWDFHARGEWICVTTNGFVKRTGEAVMGRGVARQCAIRYPDAPLALGASIARSGNVVAAFLPERRIISFPTKHFWWEGSDPALIARSALQLADLATSRRLGSVYLPKPGCSNGGLLWKDVARIICPLLDERFAVVEYAPV